MRGSLFLVGLVLFFITLTVGSAFRHSARKQWKNSFQSNDEDSLGKYFWLRQELKESQCVSVCPSGTSLSRAVNLHLYKSEINQRAIRAFREQSDSTQRTLREHSGTTKRALPLLKEQSESNQSITMRVIQSEPKILRLIYIRKGDPIILIAMGNFRRYLKTRRSIHRLRLY